MGLLELGSIHIDENSIIAPLHMGRCRIYSELVVLSGSIVLQQKVGLRLVFTFRLLGYPCWLIPPMDRRNYQGTTSPSSLNPLFCDLMSIS